MSAGVLHGDCRDVLPTHAADSFDAAITDPPYELGFMGRAWDKSGVAFDPATWAAVLRVLKPGGYMLAMGGSRTYHRLACAVEDAGFEIRDCLMWMYGTGFPKGKGCLKPAWEPILLARKPGPRVLGLGIDACRVPCEGERLSGGSVSTVADGWDRPWKHDPEAVAACKARSADAVAKAEKLGRYPANVLHDGSDEVMEAFRAFGERRTHATGSGGAKTNGANNVYSKFGGEDKGRVYESSSGTAARFFYCAKASKSERGEGNTHPTVKPLALMRWMVRLATPAGGCVLDPFAGSGSTLVAATLEGFDSVGVELDAKHCDIIRGRLAEHQETGLFAEASA